MSSSNKYWPILRSLKGYWTLQQPWRVYMEYKKVEIFHSHMSRENIHDEHLLLRIMYFVSVDVD